MSLQAQISAAKLNKETHLVNRTRCGSAGGLRRALHTLPQVVCAALALQLSARSIIPLAWWELRMICLMEQCCEENAQEPGRSGLHLNEAIRR